MELEEKALINQLRLERFDKLTLEEKGQLVRKLKDQSGYSYRKLQELTGINHSTLQDWVSGRQDNSGANAHISLSLILKKVKEYEFKTEIEFEMLGNLKKIINEKLENAK